MLAAATGAACRNRVDPGLIAPAVLVGLITLDARAPWEPILTAAPDTKVNLAWATVIVLAVPVIASGWPTRPARPTPTRGDRGTSAWGTSGWGTSGRPTRPDVPQPALTVLRAPNRCSGRR